MVRSAGGDSGQNPRVLRRRLFCRGAVQGVGFRPAVHRLATALGLSGSVRNDPVGAVIEIEGPDDSIREFLDRLPGALPPLARLEAPRVETIAPRGESGFTVLDSTLGPRRGALLPPDAALCTDCRREMETQGDRRLHYPFTTCTNCGPRFSVSLSLPYDRERTSMACFPLCADCRREYTDTSDRRFHAEPVCCPACGPRLRLLDGEGRVEAEGDDAVRAAQAALVRGAIVAVKGLGGFQLACRADLTPSVRLLRERKRRPTKPFAVMVRDLDAARRLVRLSAEDERELASPRAPVLLASRLRPAPLAAEVAPGIEDLGVMLPTTPLHVELFREASYAALVMTSGNGLDEPICRGNREALSRLSGIAEHFLIHDRDVARRVDDSVVRSAPGGPIVVRRARGFVPEPLPLPDKISETVVAVGGHLQVAACVAVDGEAFLTQHVGDLDNELARAFLVEAIEGQEEFLQTRGRSVAVDLHPDYPSTWIGEEMAAARRASVVRVQHHLAHAAAVLAEHGLFPRPGERAAAIILDGTGWGPDEVAWGGEWLLLDGSLAWWRLAHLDAIPLVGGEKAVREPWRVVAASLALEGEQDLLKRLPLVELVPREQLKEIVHLTNRSHWPRATGAGRIFEAAGALLGLAAVNEWEGEAAVRLESLAATWMEAGEVWDDAALRADERGVTLPGAALLAAAARRAAAGEGAAKIASGFHATFCHLAVEVASRVVPRGTVEVALGGGCLVNRLLLHGLTEGLKRAGFEPRSPRAIPPGDGGLSYGQAVVAARAIARGEEPVLKRNGGA